MLSFTHPLTSPFISSPASTTPSFVRGVQIIGPACVSNKSARSAHLRERAWLNVARGCRASRSHRPFALTSAQEEKEAVEKTLSHVFRYAIKATAPSSVARALVRPDGLEGDRQWMVATRGGRFISQRDLPQLATISATLHSDVLNVVGRTSQPPLNITVRTGLRSLSATVWGDTVTLLDEGEDAARWLAVALGGAKGSLLPYLGLPSYRLLRAPASGCGRRARLADIAPVHLLCEASVLDLNMRRAAEGKPPVALGRFRANLVVSGCRPYEEDSWQGLCIAIGSTEFRVDGACPRCSVPDVDQFTGVVDSPMSGPMRTLRQYRTRPGIGVTFGVYLYPLSSGSVAVGEPLVPHICA